MLFNLIETNFPPQVRRRSFSHRLDPCGHCAKEEPQRPLLVDGSGWIGVTRFSPPRLGPPPWRRPGATLTLTGGLAPVLGRRGLGACAAVCCRGIAWGVGFPRCFFELAYAAPRASAVLEGLRLGSTASAAAELASMLFGLRLLLKLLGLLSSAFGLTHRFFLPRLFDSFGVALFTAGPDF